MDKAANLLGISIYKVETSDSTKSLRKDHLKSQIDKAEQEGIKYFIVVANMMTTMFGSIDSVDTYYKILTDKNCEFKIHIDGAFGGFYYPFSNKENNLNFSNQFVTSVTLDAHKMAQAPYGTGIFLIRKGFMHYATTKKASYVEGEDCTLIGSRSGANAVAIWMILSKYGPNGWFEKIFVLQKRTDWLCKELNDLNLDFFRDPDSNIVTIRSSSITHEIAKKHNLVPDNQHEANCYKIVVKKHITIKNFYPFFKDLKIHF